MPTTAELQALLQFPTEKLTVEYKSWLDLSDNGGKATLAKAAIALANEGGGVIVMGMREDTEQGGALVSQPRPAALARYTRTTSMPRSIVMPTRNFIVRSPL